jgi:hypothetical protein
MIYFVAAAPYFFLLFLSCPFDTKVISYVYQNNI